MTSLLIKLFIKDGLPEAEKREKIGSLSGFTGIVCNLLLCVFKITAGILTKGISIIADGVNNLTDMGSSVITVICFKLSGKPADSDHPYGHGRMEYVSAFSVSFLILVVGAELLISSVKSLINGTKAPVFSKLSLIILAVSIAVKLWMYIFNRRLSRKIDSTALAATARDSLNDAVSTLAVLAAAIASNLLSPRFNLDAVMALFVSLFVLWSGISSAKNTIDEILGTPPDKALIDEIKQCVMSFDGFLGLHDLIIHNYGPGRQFASVHVEVPQTADIAECHEKIDLCEKLVRQKTDVSLVIHMDPIDADNENVTQTKKKVQDALKTIDSRLSLHDFRMTPPGEQRTNLIFDVVVPYDVKLSHEELLAEISRRVKDIDPSFECVITFDNDFC